LSRFAARYTIYVAERERGLVHAQRVLAALETLPLVIEPVVRATAAPPS
jgi:hypothetical protein